MAWIVERAAPFVRRRLSSSRCKLILDTQSRRSSLHSTYNFSRITRFMQSDSWWSFAMAINVYLVFFWHASPDTFRHYLWAYCIVCYGIPMIPAVLFVSLRLPHGLIFGDATVRFPQRIPGVHVPSAFVAMSCSTPTRLPFKSLI